MGRIVSTFGEGVGDLEDMGLTQQEAVVYCALVTKGPSPARRLSETVNIRREHCYNALKSLQRKGLVEVALCRPSLFVAVSPKQAVSSFVSEIESRSELLKAKAHDVGNWLDDMRAKAMQEPTQEEVPLEESTLKIIFGKRVLFQVARELEHCKSEYVSICPSAPSLWTSLGWLDYLDHLVEASKRGVAVKIIVDLSGLELGDGKVAKRYAKHIDFRHNRDMLQGARFSVFDRSIILLSLNRPTPKVENLKMIRSTDLALVEGLRTHFERAWTVSKPFSNALVRA